MVRSVQDCLAKYDTSRIRVMHNNLECPLVTDRSALVLVSKTYGKYLHVIRCFVLSDCCNFRIVHVRWAWAPFYVQYNFVTQNYHISGGARCFNCFIVINLCSACRTYKKVFQFLSVNLFCRFCTELLICVKVSVLQCFISLRENVSQLVMYPGSHQDLEHLGQGRHCQGQRGRAQGHNSSSSSKVRPASQFHLLPLYCLLMLVDSFFYNLSSSPIDVCLYCVKEIKGMWKREEVHGEDALLHLQPTLPATTRTWCHGRSSFCLVMLVLVFKQPCVYKKRFSLQQSHDMSDYYTVWSFLKSC